MKKKFYSMLSMVFIAVLVLVGCSSDKEEKPKENDSGNSGSSDEVIELNVNNWASSTHHYAYNIYEPWKELVEEKTDGRVVVNLYHGSSLGKSSSVYQDVSGGLYDVGLIVANYFYDTGFFPYTIGNLPFSLEGPKEAENILAEFGAKYADEDLADIIIMGSTATDGYDLFASKAIKSASDLKGLKMRVNGKSENAFVQAIGGVPVSLATEDTYDGLQKGTIDTTFYTPIGGEGLKLFEPAPYVTKLSVSVTPVVPIMNKKFYDSLPDDLKTLFAEELNPKLNELFTESYETELETAYGKLTEAVADRGEMITLSDAEIEGFRTYGKEAWDAWVEDANKKGYPGEEMVADYFKMLEAAGYPLPY